MNRLVWGTALALLVACSGGPQEPPTLRTGPAVGASVQPDAPVSEPKPPDKVALGGGVSATYCKEKRPFASWGDYESKFAFCERFASRVAVCDYTYTARTPAETCSHLDRISDREMEIIEECMRRPIELAKVPAMIDQVEVCECGPQILESNVCRRGQCDAKFACLRRAGFNWSPPARSASR